MGLQSVLRQTGKGKVAVEQHSIPIPGPDEVLIRVKAVAVNPLDWKLLYYREPPNPTVLGCDCSGVVHSLGENVRRFEVGDRVAGMIHGGNIMRPDDGAFAEFVVSPAHLLLHLPDHISFEDGSTLGVPLLTGGFCLYKTLAMPYPGETTTNDGEPPEVLIYGGGTSIGLMQIQLAALSRLKTITVCSEDSFNLVQKYGAHTFFDYRAPSCLQSVAEFTQGNMRSVVDCISNTESAPICAAAMEACGGTYISCDTPGPYIDHPKVQTVKITAFTMLGYDFRLFPQEATQKVVPGDVDFGAEFVLIAERLLKDHKLQPLAAEVRQGGLGGIISGIDELMTGKVRNKRLVYQI